MFLLHSDKGQKLQKPDRNCFTYWDKVAFLKHLRKTNKFRAFFRKQ